MSIFETAARRKVRFSSARGELTAEQLWDLPLSSARGSFSLDGIARTVYGELQALTEPSFVEVSENPRKAELDLQLDILKRVIEVKKAENAARLEAAAKAEKRAQLIEALADKESDEIKSLSKEELQKRLEELTA